MSVVNTGSITELAANIGCEVRAIGKALFKGTECGIVFDHDADSVMVSGYAEGADAECEPIKLRFPFTMGEFWAAVQEADDEGCEMWHAWNDDPEDELANVL